MRKSAFWLIVTLFFVAGCGPTRPKNANVDIFPIINARRTVSDTDTGWQKEESGKALLFFRWNNGKSTRLYCYRYGLL